MTVVKNSRNFGDEIRRTMKLSEIKLNKNNPRLIKDDRFKKLVQSIREFPAMMSLRPIVVNSDMVILGGNMRYRACLEIGIKEIPDEWVKIADSLTEEEQRRFIIEDNVPFGEWDYDILANEWNEVLLKEWGMELESGKTFDEQMEDLFDDDELIEITASVRKVYFDEVHKLIRKKLNLDTSPEIDDKCISFLIYSKKIYDIMNKGDKFGHSKEKRYAIYLPINYSDLKRIIDKANGDILAYLQSKLYA